MAYIVQRGGMTTKTGGMIQVGPDLKISQKNHDKLVGHIVKCLEAWNWYRGPQVQRFREIDKEIAGHLVPTKEDQKRILDNRKGKGGPKTVNEHIQFALMQMDEAVTYFLGVFADEGSMYSAVTTRDKQTIANGLTQLMNQHARTYQHYRHFARSFLDALKYNIGGHFIRWDEKKGRKITGSIGGSPEIKLNQIIRQGNELVSIDPYNFIADPAVYPVDVPTRGQFAGGIELIRPFELQKMDAENFYFGAAKCEYNQGDLRFFEARPAIQHQYLAGGQVTTNWDSFWSNKYYSDINGVGFDGTVIERTEIYMWLNPKDYGLGPKDDMQIWRIHMLNNKRIALAQYQSNVHDQLPCAIMMPNEDGMNLQSRTFAEVLLPFQKFASAQLNLHQAASRKRLYGITIYNRRVIPVLENEDLTGGKIPANPISDDYNLNNAIVHLNDAPDTTRTMQDVKDSLELMQKMLPSVQPGQVASLERATRYQSAAYVQATNRRNQKMAKLMNSQAIDPNKRMQLQNILQFQPQVEITDNETGQNVTVNPDELRAAKIEFTLSDGLKGLDKMVISESLQEIINMLLQSPVAKDYDMGGIIDYFLELQGEKMDFTQFKYLNPIDALPEEYKQVAFMLLQQLDQVTLKAALQEAVVQLQARKTPAVQNDPAAQQQQPMTALSPPQKQ